MDLAENYPFCVKDQNLEHCQRGCSIVTCAFDENRMGFSVIKTIKNVLAKADSGADII